MHLGSVGALPCLLGASIPVVAVDAHALGVVALIFVWALYDLLVLCGCQMVRPWDSRHSHHRVHITDLYGGVLLIIDDASALRDRKLL